MEKHLLSKSTFIRSTQCLKSLYLHKRRPFLRDRLSAEQLAKFKRGTDVGILAQHLFPGGADLQPKSPAQYRKSVVATGEQLETKDDFTIYEASFQSDQILIILDILEQKEGKIYAYEVKSSLAISETYLKDAALQFYVIEESGTKIEDFFIVYINEDYQFTEDELDLNQFFKIESVLNKVLELQSYIKKQIPKAKETLTLKHSPEISIGPQCHSPYPCDFRRHCWKHLPKESIFDLPFLSEAQKFEMHSKEIFEIYEVENYFNLSEIEKIKLNCHLNQNTHFNNSKIKSYIDEINYPINFINLSNISSAVPRWKNCKPFEPIPFHISILTLSEDQQYSTSSFMLSSDETSPKEAIGSYLTEAMSPNSSIVIFDQKEILKKIPGFTEEFQINDLVDLISENVVYHPGITEQISLQDINTELLKNKRNKSMLSQLQVHQKLNTFLDDEDEQKNIIKEVEQSGEANNQVMLEFWKILQGIIE